MTEEPLAAGELDQYLGAVRPSNAVRGEILEFLANDESRVGQVFRGRD